MMWTHALTVEPCVIFVSKLKSCKVTVCYLLTRHTLVQCWCQLTHTKTWRSTPRTTWSDTAESISMRSHHTCKYKPSPVLPVCSSAVLRLYIFTSWMWLTVECLLKTYGRRSSETERCWLWHIIHREHAIVRNNPSCSSPPSRHMVCIHLCAWPGL